MYFYLGLRGCFRRCLSVCLSVCLLATLQKLTNGFARHFQANEQTIKFCGRSGSPPGIVFRMGHYREIRKVVSTNCAVRCGSAEQALAGIAIATITSLRHRPTTVVPWRRYALSQCFLYLFMISPSDRCRSTAQLMKDRDRQQ